MPISTRLMAVLEMRRTGPDGVAFPPDAYVFGNGIGQQVKNVKRAWQRALLRAHGHASRYVERIVRDGTRRRKVRTAMLTSECLAALAQIDLFLALGAAASRRFPPAPR